MKKIRYIISAAIFVMLIIFIVSKKVKDNYYTLDTEKVYSMTIDSSVIVNKNGLSRFAGDPVIVSLSEPDKPTDTALINFTVRYVKPADLLSRENKNFYKKNNAPILLYSDDESLAAQAWVILTKKGFKNLYVLDMNARENLNYSFQPES